MDNLFYFLLVIILMFVFFGNSEDDNTVDIYHCNNVITVDSGDIYCIDSKPVEPVEPVERVEPVEPVEPNLLTPPPFISNIVFFMSIVVLVIFIVSRTITIIYKGL